MTGQGHISRDRIARRVVGVPVSFAVICVGLASGASAHRLVYAVARYRDPNAAVIMNPFVQPRPAVGVPVRRVRIRAGPSHPAYPAHALARPRPQRVGSLASAPALYTGAGFPGLAGTGFYPADAQLAVGHSDIVEMVNSTVGIYSRQGALLDSFPLTSIFGGSGDNLGDPQIAWDPTTGLWLASAMDITTDSTNIAVSDGPDPDQGWVDYTFGFGSSLCPDQPRLGFSSSVVIVATELFQGDCRTNVSPLEGGVMLVISKQELLAHASRIEADQYGPDLAYSNYVPVQMLGPSQVDYVASTDMGASNYVHVFTLTGVPPNDKLGQRDTLLISTLRNPTPAAEAGGRVISAGDDRINDATWSDGRLFLAADDRCTYANDPYLETCARLMEISTAAGPATLIGENDIGFPNADAYYAAIRPDAHGNVITVLDWSDPNHYPSVAAIGALGPIAGEQGGNFTEAIELANGTSPTIPRWGDYSGASVDPNNPDVIWTAGQVADGLASGSAYNWATHIDAVSLTGSVPAPLPHEVDPGYLYRGTTSQHHRVRIRPSGGGRHIARAQIRLGLNCAGGGQDILIFTLSHEGQQVIRGDGYFHIHRSFAGDRYATGYAMTLDGIFTPGQVTGRAWATEHSRKYGLCRARGVRFIAGD